MRNDEHENIIKQFILTNFTADNLDYGYKQPFSGGMKYVVKLKNQMHTMGTLYLDKLQELHDILAQNFTPDQANILLREDQEAVEQFPFPMSLHAVNWEQIGAYLINKEQ